MPSATQTQPKKRRRDEDDPDASTHLPIPHGFHPHEQHQNEHHTASPRKIIPYSNPLAKKIRMNHSPEEHQQQQHPYQQRHISPHRIRSPSKQQSPPKAINISPCHICHRKPTKKSDLDSYADCESCGQRTCYICIRQCWGRMDTPASGIHDNDADPMRDHDHNDCTEDDEDGENREPGRMERSFCMEDAPPGEEKLGGSPARINKGGTWDGGQGRSHWGRICSQCCVEKGPQGEVVCLGCLES